MADARKSLNLSDDTRRLVNMEGTIYPLGGRVRHNDGWTGTIIGFRGIYLLVQPDDETVLGGFSRYRLNAEAAARHGQEWYVAPRDKGASMGNYTPIDGNDNDPNREG